MESLQVTAGVTGDMFLFHQAVRTFWNDSSSLFSQEMCSTCRRRDTAITRDGVRQLPWEAGGGEPRFLLSIGGAGSCPVGRQKGRRRVPVDEALGSRILQERRRRVPGE